MSGCSAFRAIRSPWSLFNRLCIFVFLIFLFCNTGYAQESKEIYYQAVQAAKSGDLDSAFMFCQSLLGVSPESKYKADALFASGEYYFAIGDYRDANKTFIKLISDFPDSKVRLFALAYLLKIAESQDNAVLIENLENKIATFEQLTLFFKNSKEYKYKSLLYKTYKAVHYIDKIQFYLNGELFTQISY